MSAVDGKPCGMCLNARVDPDLTDENDLSFHEIRRIRMCGLRLNLTENSNA